jgi:hypothetical protein
MTHSHRTYDASLDEIRLTLATGRKWHAMPKLLDDLDRARRALAVSRARDREIWVGRFVAATRASGSALDDARVAEPVDRLWRWLGAYDPEAIGARRWDHLPRSYG